MGRVWPRHEQRGRPLNAIVRQRMGAACPKCRGPLRWWRLRNEFACPHCGAPLTASTTATSVTFIILWIIADFPVRLAVFAMLGSEGAVAVAARILASGAVGCLLAYIVVAGFTTVKVRAESWSGP